MEVPVTDVAPRVCDYGAEVELLASQAEPPPSETTDSPAAATTIRRKHPRLAAGDSDHCGPDLPASAAPIVGLEAVLWQRRHAWDKRDAVGSSRGNRIGSSAL